MLLYASQQIRKSLDSLTQICGEEKSSTYAVEKILLKDEGNRRTQFSKVAINEDSIKIYSLKENDSQPDWKMDYNQSKNILGFTCYKAEKKNDSYNWAWITLDIPYSLSPAKQLSIPGVVLEMVYGSSKYIARGIQFKNEEKLEPFIPSDCSVDLVADRTALAFKLMGGSKISSDKFECWEK